MHVCISVCFCYGGPWANRVRVQRPGILSGLSICMADNLPMFMHSIKLFVTTIVNPCNNNMLYLLYVFDILAGYLKLGYAVLVEVEGEDRK